MEVDRIMSNILDKMCNHLEISNVCPPKFENSSCSYDCTPCWRRYLLHKIYGPDAIEINKGDLK
jgi:hypothetical protein